MIKVLFVCLGNICRSPMAEAMFRDEVKKQNLDHVIEVDSAGTGHWHIGEPPHDGTKKILKQYDISTDGLKARQLQKNDAVNFNYIVAMDESNYENIHKLFGPNADTKVVRLLDPVETSTVKDVPDPYFTGNFEEVYQLIKKGNHLLLEEIKKDME